MTTEDREEFGGMKAAILNASFTPIGKHGFNCDDYGPGVVGAKMPQHFDDIGLLRVIDRYTSGNSGAVVGPGPACGQNELEQWIIMRPEVASELKARLRTNKPMKYTTKEGIDDLELNARSR